jgi:hypothetical protein
MRIFYSSLCVQTGSGVHPPSYPLGTGSPFPGSKTRPWRDADHSPHLVPRSWMSRSYTCSTSAPPWCVVAVLYFQKLKLRSLRRIYNNIFFPNRTGSLWLKNYFIPKTKTVLRCGSPRMLHGFQIITHQLLHKFRLMEHRPLATRINDIWNVTGFCVGWEYRRRNVGRRRKAETEIMLFLYWVVPRVCSCHIMVTANLTPLGESLRINPLKSNQPTNQKAY